MPRAELPNYETTYILRSGLSETDASSIHQKVDSVISKFQGKVAHRDDCGLRDLAYSIKNQSTGRVCVLQYNGKPGVVEEIERHFKISGDVIRYITVLVDGDYDYAKLKKQIHLGEEEVKQNRDVKKRVPFN